MKKSFPPFVGLSSLTEEERIQVIGRTVMERNNVVGFIVDDHDKADRYMVKLREKSHGIVEQSRFMLAGQITVRVAPPVARN